jgi:hypothetical protein
VNRETIKRLNGGAARLLLVLLTCDGTETLEDLPNLIEMAGLPHTQNSHGKNRYARAFRQLEDLGFIEVQGGSICVPFEHLIDTSRKDDSWREDGAVRYHQDEEELMSTQTQRPDTLLTEIRVPEGIGHRVHTLVCKIAEDGTLTLPTGYTPEQEAALLAYLTSNDEHLCMPRGASLRIMGDWQQALLGMAIETLKSPAQKLRDRTETLVLAAHKTRGEHWRAFMSFFNEVTYPPHKQAWVDEHKLPAMSTPLYEVLITEGKAWNDRLHQPYVVTLYRVAHDPDTDELTIIASWPGMSDLPGEEEE